ncbi:MAG: radical SAM protein, partial [Nitrospira sp.]|nr:radical SAM protein [Nitrospira sp.]
FFDKVRAKQVLRELIDLGVRVEFPNGVAVYAIDEEVASLFRQAGVSTVALAVESGSDYVLHRIIKKPLKTSLVNGKVELLRQYGVQSHVFIVLGLPGETDEYRRQTLELLLDVGFDWVHVFCAVPILGSRLYDICVTKGYLETDDFLDHVNTKSVIRAPGVDPEVVQAYAYEMNLLVNFVRNYNLEVGRFHTAAKYFENVTNKYPDHALAHHALARAYEGLGRMEEASHCHQRFKDIIERDVWWRERARKYGLSDDGALETPHSVGDLHALMLS